MKLWVKKLSLVKVIALLWMPIATPTIAQVVPDKTLPVNSRVIRQGNTSLVESGTQRGNNLFHSFDRFSVNTDGVAYFNNALNVQNIISRVTGGSASNINGLIRANGTSNLFLLNPNGIIFGPNASLNVGGSFTASSAEGLTFADGTQFEAKLFQSEPLLTISIPVGLSFVGTLGQIKAVGPGHQLAGSGGPGTSGVTPIANGSSGGLQVQPGKTLALIGGDVSLQGAILSAEGGRIEVGSAKRGVVRMSSTPLGLSFSYEGVPSFNDILLSKRSLIDASGIGSGSIQIQGRKVSFMDGSVVLHQNQGLLPAGPVSLTASESFELSGTDPIAAVAGAIDSETLGLGRGGDIYVNTPKLVLTEGGVITTRSFSPADSGNIFINAPGSVTLDKGSPREPRLTSRIFSLAFSSGKSGNISVSTGDYLATGGGFLFSGTAGTEPGGKIKLDATRSITLTGVQPQTFQPSLISSLTIGPSKAGRVEINTPRLVVKDGGRVDSSTAASGDAGEVFIDAYDSVEVTGRVQGSRNPSLITSSATLLDETLREAIGVEAPTPSGSSGDLVINTRQLNVTEGAQITVRNDGPKEAGDIRINANYITLNNQGGITASTAGGRGGDIALQNKDLLLLQGNSNISASAGGTGTGGNISIHSSLLTALENSDISADAIGGDGGQVKIDTQAIFGTKAREQRTLESDITATSRLGPQFRGTVEINTPELDFAKASSPPAPPPESPKIASVCQGRAGAASSEFIRVGAGGTPTSPYALQEPNSVWVPQSPQAKVPELASAISAEDDLNPVQGWILYPDGTMRFTTKPGVHFSPSLTSACNTTKRTKQ